MKKNKIAKIIEIILLLSLIISLLFLLKKMVIPLLVSSAIFIICCIIIVNINKQGQNKNHLNKSNIEMNKIALEIATILNELYEMINNETQEITKKERKYLILRIKDQSIAKNCALTDINQFIQRVSERTTTIGYELTTGWIICNDLEDECEKTSKITVKISADDIIKIDYQQEIKIEKFDEILAKIETLIKNKYGKNVEINHIIQKENESKVEYIDFGILGKYKYNSIQYETEEELTPEEFETKIRNVLNDYNIHIDEINKKIFYEMYKILTETDYEIWKTESFNIIIDKEKLPQNFDILTKQQKNDFLYLYEYNDYNDLWNNLQKDRPFWNLNKIKEDITITNFIINDNYGKITIEFNGFFSLLTAYIKLNYKENYEIDAFDPN